ncbi:MAG: radical SAM protein [bacterium]
MKSTGFDEVSLLSLSSGDYSPIKGLVEDLIDYCATKNVSVSLPSLRLDGFADEIPRNLERIRAGGLTFAPEAGTERLRRAINKPIEDATILRTITSAMSRHWENCKLYFMVGLPSETDEDILGITELSLRIRRELTSQGWRRGTLHISIGTFCPKPHTPYQWCGQIPDSEIRRRIEMIRSALRHRRIKLSTHDTEPSILEAILSRGNIQLSSVIEAAFHAGCRFDEWSECFQWERWLEAFAQSDLHPSALAEKTYEREDLLPWSVVDCGLNPQYLWHEHVRTFNNRVSLHCGHRQCRACGVCDTETVFTVRAPLRDSGPETPRDVDTGGTFRYRLKYEKQGASAWLSHRISLAQSTPRSAGHMSIWCSHKAIIRIRKSSTQEPWQWA